MEITITFIKLFFFILYLIFPLLLTLLLIVVILGQVVGRIENWSRFNALYWTFMTALTVGYGDLCPSKKKSKLLAILIAFTGFMLTGLIVAVTVATATEAFKGSVNPAVLHDIQERIHK
ncbi:MAG: potassium channel family protein [Gammaproteobacteria bacterium]|nr:potassium channel family protein [Gammaproteobacteria bacterium]